MNEMKFLDIFTPLELGAGQIAEFPLDLFYPGQENINHAYFVNKDNVEKAPAAEYVTIPLELAEDKLEDVARQLIMKCGIVCKFLDDEDLWVKLVGQHTYKSKLLNNIDNVYYDNRIVNLNKCSDCIPVVFPNQFMHCNENEAIVIIVDNTNASPLVVKHGDNYGLAILDVEGISIFKVGL